MNIKQVICEVKMNLEDIFSENMINLKNRIDTIGSKYPNLMKAFSFKKNDPHVEKMINAFALISASLEHEVAKKMAKEIRSIFLNIYPDEFATNPPVGIIKITPNQGKHFKINKNQILRDTSNIFKIKRDFYINDIKITKITKTFYKNQLGIEILINGNNLNELTNIDFFMDLNTLNHIFASELSIKAIIKNREYYDSECDLSLHEDFSIKEFAFNHKQQCFCRLNNLTLQNNIQNNLEIFIPLKYNLNNEPNIQTNCLVAINRFSSQSYPFLLENNKECIIPIDSNHEIIKVNKILNLNGKVIPYVNEDLSGWHCVINKENICVYIDQPFHETVFCEIECFNKEINVENPYFDEYIPGYVSWVENPSEPLKYIYNNEVSKLIQFIYLDQKTPKEIFTIISQLLSNVEFSNIEEIETIKPVKVLNYIIPQIHAVISCLTNSKNFLLLRNVVYEIKKRTNSEVQILFNTSLGEVLYE
jgi:hypothetical protein